jgi:hypothetical protein
MTYLASTIGSIRFALLLMAGVGAGCASKNDSPSGSGASSGRSSGGTGGDSGEDAAGGAGGGLTQLQFWGALSVAGEEWGAFETSCPTYHYQLHHFGSCSTPTVGVVNGNPAERSFTSDTGASNPAADAGAADPARTIQELLNYCPTILPTNSSDYTLSFTYGGHGVPITCSATLIDCAGDCTTGFQVSDFGCDQIPAG